MKLMQVVYDAVIFTKQVSGISDILFILLLFVCAPYPFSGPFIGQSFSSIELINLKKERKIKGIASTKTSNAGQGLVSIVSQAK